MFTTIVTRRRAAEIDEIQRGAAFTREGVPIHIGAAPKGIMDAPSPAVVLSSRARVALNQAPAWRRTLFFGLAALANLAARARRSPPPSRL